MKKYAGFEEDEIKEEDERWVLDKWVEEGVASWLMIIISKNDG